MNPAQIQSVTGTPTTTPKKKKAKSKLDSGAKLLKKFQKRKSGSPQQYSPATPTSTSNHLPNKGSPLASHVGPPPFSLRPSSGSNLVPADSTSPNNHTHHQIPRTPSLPLKSNPTSPREDPLPKSGATSPSTDELVRLHTKIATSVLPPTGTSSYHRTSQPARNNQNSTALNHSNNRSISHANRTTATPTTATLSGVQPTRTQGSFSSPSTIGLANIKGRINDITAPHTNTNTSRMNNGQSTTTPTSSFTSASTSTLTPPSPTTPISTPPTASTPTNGNGLASYQLPAIKSAFDVLVGEKNSLLLQLSKLKSERDRAVQTMHAANERVSNEQSRMMKLENKLLVAESTEQRHAAQLKHSQDQTQAVRTEVARLKEALDESHELRNQIESQLAQRSQPFESAPPTSSSSTQVLQLTSQLETANEKISQTSRGLDQLKAEKEILLQRWRTSHTEAQTLKADLAQLQNTQAEQSQRFDAQVSELEALRRKSSTTNAVLAALEEKDRVDEGSLQKREEVVNRMQVTLSEEIQKQRETEAVLREELKTTKTQQATYERLLQKNRGDAELISRATSQNKTLKLRLVELEDKFIEITNQKMELTNQLDTLRHNTENQKIEQMHQAFVELQQSRDKIVEECNDMKTKLSKAQGQVDDFQALTQVNASLKEQIVSINNEVSVLRKQLEGKSAVERAISTNSGQNLVDSLYMQISQLEMERTQFMEESKRHQSERNKLAKSLALASSKSLSSSRDDERDEGLDLGGDDAANSTTPDNDDMRTNSNNADTSTSPSLPLMPDGSKPPDAMVLRVKIVQLQTENLSLIDARDDLVFRLEHMKDTNADMSNRLKIEQQLTTQLAQETETIGEYITLYHKQRQTLASRLHEKDVIIARLQKAVNEGLQGSAQNTPEMMTLGIDNNIIPKFMQQDKSFFVL
eukprot:m.91787 g.91787  ORF g.91787 m.91787 type:complete len:925 (+) comp26502_c0_seq1:280-3054(+)